LPDCEQTGADLNLENSNTATHAETALLNEFDAFQDCQEYNKMKANDLKSKGYQFIKLMLVYNVKHDGCSVLAWWHQVV
jgi:hypothetical protein